LINVFLVSLLANTFLEIWNQIIADTTSLSPIGILLLLAANIGVQSSIFMIYILALSFGQTISILHPANLILGAWRRWSAVTPREKIAATLPSHYQIHIDMAQHCLVFLAVINFSTISPLILPIGLFYLCLTYFQLAFETTYTSCQEYDGFGAIFPSIMNRLLASLILYQIVMTAMFVLTTFYYGVIFSVLCIVGTILFIYKLRNISRVSKYGMLHDVTGDEQRVLEREDDISRGYIHPGMWDPTIDLEDINRLAYSIKIATDVPEMNKNGVEKVKDEEEMARIQEEEDVKP